MARVCSVLLSFRLALKTSVVQLSRVRTKGIISEAADKKITEQKVLWPRVKNIREKCLGGAWSWIFFVFIINCWLEQIHLHQPQWWVLECWMVVTWVLCLHCRQRLKRHL